MTQFPDSSPQVVIQTTGQRSNGLGVAGFVLSLVGFISCGLLSPLAVILSAVGLRKEPRGLAVAGLTLGLLGSMWMVLGGLACAGTILGIGAGIEAVDRTIARVDTLQAVRDVRTAISAYESARGGLPRQADWRSAAKEYGASTIVDGWDNELRYKKLRAREYEVRSAGEDGEFDTADDITGSDGG